MPGENPDPNTAAAEIIAFGFKLTKREKHYIDEFNTADSAQAVTHFAKRSSGTRASILWDRDQFEL